MIVKVQIPLMTSKTTGMALIYNKNKTVFLQAEVTEVLLDKMNGNIKDFFHAEITEDGQLSLGEAAENQNW